jgi:hypothetical protein
MEYGLGLNVRALKAILWMVIRVVLLNQGIVLVLPLGHLGTDHNVYVRHNLLTEVLVNVNIICGVETGNVIMGKL